MIPVHVRVPVRVRVRVRVRVHVLVLVLVLVLGACSRHERVDNCQDDLSGVWHEVGNGDRGYDWRPSRSGGYEVFAMYDTARPPDGSDKLSSPIVYAPWVWDLERMPAGIAGTQLQRLTRDGKSCEARTPVEVRRCEDGKVAVAAKRVEGMEFEGCVARVGDWVEVVLER